MDTLTKEILEEFDKIQLQVKIYPDSDESQKEAMEKGVVVDVVWDMIKPQIESFLFQSLQKAVEAERQRVKDILLGQSARIKKEVLHELLTIINNQEI